MVDSWFEEDTEIYIHPKDPNTRVDVLPSQKRIVVKVDDVIIAESGTPVILYETGLRPRYYLPKTSANWEYLESSDITTGCPYKGVANHYNIVINGKVYEDHAWWHRYPTLESAAIVGKICFYNEKVDIYIDGVQEKK
jgi:uncharacterized protein (DUF427 family)